MTSPKRRKPKARPSRVPPRRPRPAASSPTVVEALESTMNEIADEVGRIAASVVQAFGIGEAPAARKRPKG